MSRKAYGVFERRNAAAGGVGADVNRLQWWFPASDASAALGRDNSSPFGRVITKQEKKVNVSAERM